MVLLVCKLIYFKLEFCAKKKLIAAQYQRRKMVNNRQFENKMKILSQQFHFVEWFGYVLLVRPQSAKIRRMMFVLKKNEIFELHCKTSLITI